jgi:hypothetical protein
MLDAPAAGRAIIEIAKSLRAFSSDNPQITRHFSATRLAGRAGLFASSIRGYSTSETALGQRKVEVLYNDAGIDFLTFQRDVRRWLERNGLAYFVEREEGEQLVSTVLTYDALLRAVTELFEHLVQQAATAAQLTDTERATHQLVALASEIPLPESVVLDRLAAEYSEAVARVAVDLARGFRLVTFSQPPGASEAVLYSDRVWKTLGNRAARALPTFGADHRAALEVMVQQVRDYQGMPESQLRRWAVANSAEQMLEFAIGVGLIARTGIRGAQGTVRHFLTTPHFYADVAEQFGEDVCDRVKLFLDSVRNGQHFSESARGRVADPVALLHALLNRGSVGPATAIGEDYTMVERAGIVSIERSSVHGNRHYMVLLQSDVVEKTLEVVERQQLDPPSGLMTAQSIDNTGTFLSIQETRAALAELPGEMQDAEREFLNSLREG